MQIFTEGGFKFYFNVQGDFNYTVVFTDASYLLNQDLEDLRLFQIVFDYDGITLKNKRLLLRSNPKIQSQIRESLVTIIELFLSTNNNLIFICDSTDNKEVARYRLFKKWIFASNKIKSKVNIYTDTDNNISYYTGIISASTHDFNQITKMMDNPEILNKD